MDTSPDPDREMILLEQIEHDPDITQAGLAAQLGVAVGTVNWHLKRLVSKGYVKVKRAQRRKLRYITPEGIAFRARLTVNYVDQSMRLYRRVRQRVRDLLAQVKESGSDQVGILGEGDIADICRLTCLEQGIEIVDSGNVPFLEVKGLKVHLHLNGKPVISDAIDGNQAVVE
jgi:DNA-binding MarR family transcriptional regulator